MRATRGLTAWAACLVLTTACGSTVQLRDAVPDGEAFSRAPQGQAGGQAGGQGGGQGGTSTAPSSGPVLGGPDAAAPGGGQTTPGGDGLPTSVQATPLGGRVTSPIAVGLLDVGDVSATASSLGFRTSSGATPQQLMRALVAWYDRHGGIAGRRIHAVEFTADATSTTYEAQGQAACAAFTQDSHVAVALSQTEFELSPTYESCLTKAGVPSVNGSLAGYDDTFMAANPRLFLTSAATVDRSLQAQLRGLVANGFLSPSHRIGVLVEACTYNVSAYTRTLEPLARQLHLDVQRRDFACVDSNGSIANAVAQVDAAVLPFRTAGVDRVVFVSNNQGAATVFFENQASSQGYKPWYGLTSYATAGPSASQLSADAQRRVKGVGWTPYADEGRLPTADASARRCRGAFTEMGVPYHVGDDLLMQGVCGQFFALEEALRATAGHSEPGVLAAALAQSSPSAFLLGGRRVATARRHDAARLFAAWGYRAACSCFAYEASPSELAGP